MMKVKYPYIGGTRWAFMKWADIPDRNDPTLVYLRRLRIVQTPWLSLYLHFIQGPDRDRDPHDHPWNFWSFIVRGSYSEMLFSICGCGSNNRHILPRRAHQHHGRFSLHRMPLDKAHMITEASPHLTTLVLCGRKGRDWGFYPGRGFVPWQEYGRAEGVNPPIDEFA
jgi:hypothetical protein